MRRFIFVFLAFVLSLSAGPHIFAQGDDLSRLETLMMGRLCHNLVKDVPRRDEATIKAQEYWQKRDAEIKSADEEFVNLALEAAQAELEDVSADEIAATCASEMLRDQVNNLQTDLDSQLTASEKIKIADYEARLNTVQKRLQPLMKEARVSANYGLLHANMLLGAAENLSEDDLFEFSPRSLEMLAAAMQVQSDERAPFQKKSKNVKRLLQYSEIAMRTCEWSARVDLHKAMDSKDFETANENLIRYSLWQGLINFRRGLGGEPSVRPEPAFIQKLNGNEPLKPMETTLLSTYSTLCSAGLGQQEKALDVIYTPFIGAPMKIAKISVQKTQKVPE